jgi:hypothetical protein
MQKLIDKEAEKKKAEAPPKKVDNQKFGLVIGLLEVEDWQSANGLLRKLGRIDPASYKPVMPFFFHILS